MAPFLELDPDTGVVSVSSEAEYPFDRERAEFHFLTIEARDNLGKGNRNTVELLIKVMDVNDQRPKFRKDIFEAIIDENQAEFPEPFFILVRDTSFEMMKKAL